MNVPEPIPFTMEEPQPLVRETPAGKPYPVEALGALRSAAEAAQDVTQAPVALTAQSALSVASLAVQAFADVETLGGFAPISLFCMSIADSGERKSSADKALMAGLRDQEKAMAAQYRDDMQSYRNAAAIWKIDHDSIMATFKKKSGNRDAARADLEALGHEPAAPLAPNLTATEPTLEGLHKLLTIGQPAIGVFSDEGGQFLGGYSMNSENRLKTIAGLSDLWGGSAINRTRSGDGTTTLYGRRLAAHLMVQPVAAMPLLSDPVANGQGFLARFLITQPPSAIGQRMYREPKPESGATLQAFADRLREILGQPKPTDDEDPQHLMPRQLTLSFEAKNLLIQFHDMIETQQAQGGRFEQITSFASKAPEQAARLAGVLTLWRNLEAPEVTAQDMANGITLAEYYLSEALRLADAAMISLETERAERLRDWLQKSWPSIAQSKGRNPQFVLPGDVTQFGPNSLRDTKTAKAALGVLVQHGWLQPLEKGVTVDGAARRWAYAVT